MCGMVGRRLLCHSQAQCCVQPGAAAASVVGHLPCAFVQHVHRTAHTLQCPPAAWHCNTLQVGFTVVNGSTLRAMATVDPVVNGRLTGKVFFSGACGAERPGRSAQDLGSAWDEPCKAVAAAKAELALPKHLPRQVWLPGGAASSSCLAQPCHAYRLAMRAARMRHADARMEKVAHDQLVAWPTAHPRDPPSLLALLLLQSRGPLMRSPGWPCPARGSTPTTTSTPGRLAWAWVPAPHMCPAPPCPALPCIFRLGIRFAAVMGHATPRSGVLL